jgi:3'-phosphoadenosine 5'-phosphosulfate sulfotransferase (PAPS reductase)/FAD synthetase
MDNVKTFLSLGAGVQSSTLLYLALRGELPRPDGVIFADTGGEPGAVYAHVDVLRELCIQESLPFYTVSAGNLGDDVLAALDDTMSVGPIGQPPFYVKALKADAKEGRLWRRCTNEYKIDPIHRCIRSLVGTRGRANVWLGISLDEIQRAHSSRVQWLTHVFPLLERAWTRHDCLVWLGKNSFPEPPKSSCIFCPFHSNTYWRTLRKASPDDWQKALEFDTALRRDNRLLPGVKSAAYVHRSCLPLSEAPIEDPHEQVGQLPLWGAATGDCAGVCFV